MGELLTFSADSVNFWESLWSHPKNNNWRSFKCWVKGLGGKHCTAGVVFASPKPGYNKVAMKPIQEQFMSLFICFSSLMDLLMGLRYVCGTVDSLFHVLLIEDKYLYQVSSQDLRVKIKVAADWFFFFFLLQQVWDTMPDISFFLECNIVLRPLKYVAIL